LDSNCLPENGKAPRASLEITVIWWTAPASGIDVPRCVRRRNPTGEPSTIDTISTIGLDIAKNSFALHGFDVGGVTVLVKELKLGQVPITVEFTKFNNYKQLRCQLMNSKGCCLPGSGARGSSCQSARNGLSSIQILDLLSKGGAEKPRSFLLPKGRH
jgi:hypothetical protein